MSKRSDFAQKLLDDLRLRKVRMGLAVPEQLPLTTSPVASSGYMNSRQSFHGLGAATMSPRNYNSNRSRTPSLDEVSQELIPLGRNRSQQAIDLSMALALVLGNCGKLKNIEIFGNPTVGRKIVLHMDDTVKSPHAYQFASQMGAVETGAQKLNLILKACSNGFNFNTDSIRIGKELLKGAMDLEESLKMLATLQDASDFMVGSQWKKPYYKLLKGEEEEESKTSSRNRQRAGSRSKFSFIRESRSTSEYQKPRNSVSDKSNRNSISSGCSSGGVCSISKQNQVISKSNLIPKKEWIPNVIAKLMGLEELPALQEAKSAEKQKAPGSLQLKEIRNMRVKEDDSIISVSQEKMKKEMAKNIKSSINLDGRSQASKNLKASAGKNGKIDTKNTNHENESRARIAEPQEENESTEKQIKGRIEHIFSAVGNDTRVGKRYALENREENVQQAIDKIETNDSRVKMKASEFKQKSILPILDANHDNNSRKNGKIPINEMVLKHLNDASLDTIKQSHDERNRMQVHKLVRSSQYGEETKEARAEKIADAKVKLHPSVANKLSKMSKDKESCLHEMRTMTQSSKESQHSKQKKLVNKTASETPKDNLKVSNNVEKTYMKNKSNKKECSGKEMMEQILEKRLPMKKEAKEKIVGTTVQAIVMRKPVIYHSVEKLCDLKVRDGEAYCGSSVEVTVQNIASQSMKQRNSIFEELECRWRERNSQVQEKEKDTAAATIKLNLQKEIQTTNLAEENLGISNCNPTREEDPRTATSSKLATSYVNYQASMDQRTQEEINVKIERENSASKLQERLCLTTTECVKCSQEDIMDKTKEKQTKFTESRKASDPSMQINCGKYVAIHNMKIKEADQELLTEHEHDIKQILISSQSFWITAQTLFQINTPEKFQVTKNADKDKDSRLVIDCGKELLRRKGQREEVSFSSKLFLAPLKKRSINTLIEEVNTDLESLKCQNNIQGCESDLADSLKKMIESDIQQRHPDINCLWDFGWENISFVCLEKYEIVKDVIKNMINGLLNELATDLLM